MTAAELVRPGSKYHEALEQFTCWKLLANRLGYQWQVDQKIMGSEGEFLHFDQPVVHIAIKSPRLSGECP
jgi:hypothetical protein